MAETSLSAGSEFVPETSLSAGSEFVPDTSLSAGSEFVPDTSLSAGSEFVVDYVCQPCRSGGKNAEAEKYCQDCREHLCTQCVVFHKNLSSLKDHKLVSSANVNMQIKANVSMQIEASFVADIKIRSRFLSVFSSKPLHGITGLALISVERLVAADLDHDRIMLIDTVKKKTISELKTECSPCDLTVCGGEVAVTLPYERKIIFLKYNGGLAYVRGVHVNGRCWGIDCVDDKLYVVYYEEKKLEVMTVTGSVLQRFDRNDQGEELFKDPRSVTVSIANQSIYVSDWENGGLIVLGLDGKVKDKYPDIGDFGQMAVDTTIGVMYLCDPDNDTIHLLSPVCEKVKSILTEQDSLHGPVSVCYCGSTRRLYVGMDEGNVIKVYQLFET